MNDADFQLFPEAASTVAPRVDALFWFLTILTLVLSLLIAGLIVYFSIKYRRNSNADRTPYRSNFWLEMIWIIGPLPILIYIFYWSADLFFELRRPPSDSMQVTVVARQWMWKFQHPSGKREIDVMHVPVHRPVQLTMISQDVIHSFYVPAFRVKQDVLPGRYTTVWFEPDKVGEYHLFCAEYCGTNHSRMIGRIVVLSQADYEQWLSGGSGESPQVAGMQLFERFRCASCHGPSPLAPVLRGEGQGVRGASLPSLDLAGATEAAEQLARREAEGGSPSGPQRGPPLAGIVGREVRLADGRTVGVDDAYLRESILRPQAKVVAGFQPIMPSYEGQLTEENVLELIAHIKSLDAPDSANSPDSAKNADSADNPAPSGPRQPDGGPAP
jgi:cytochrome c oxidase subunit II